MLTREQKHIALNRYSHTKTDQILNDLMKGLSVKELTVKYDVSDKYIYKVRKKYNDILNYWLLEQCRKN
jgi:hypothetical protein